MKQVVTWWNRQFDSKKEAKIWFLALTITVSLMIIVYTLNLMGVNTVIIH